MEVQVSSEISSAESSFPSAPPSLRDGEHYHVFISYSSTDYQWTHALIHQLESCGLQACYHERDFTPGRTVLENMSECINESQKVLLVLSAEFLRSRWCLLEANMSLFRDCLERKPIIPVMLEPDVSVPLHLCHLTYLEASDPAFLKKLLRTDSLCGKVAHIVYFNCRILMKMAP
uniref:TIR domain-containing protein n=1 Tax=Oryzias melastigma TaxID=30732 RepID=A0A3B3BGV4_ORYME